MADLFAGASEDRVSEASTSGQELPVYQRRRRMVDSQAEKSRQGLRPNIQLASGPEAGLRVSRPSWVHRALSVRRSSIMLERPILLSELCGDEDESSEEENSDIEPATPDLAERALSAMSNSRLGAILSPGFVSERLAYFANVKAYELEEESPQREGSPGLEEEGSEEYYSTALPEMDRQQLWRPLEAVAEEDEVEDELERTIRKDASERRSEGCKREEIPSEGASEKPQTSEQGEAFVESRPASADCEASAEKEPGAKSEESVRRLVFDDVPTNVPRGRRTSPTELAKARKGGKEGMFEACEELQRLSLKENVAPKEQASLVSRLSLGSTRRRSSLAKHGKSVNETPLQAILRACGQAMMGSLNDFISKFYSVHELTKLGEGTFGEAFKAGDMCFKIVPMGSDVKVNGEAQKTVEEMYSEVLLTNAITSIRFGDNSADNASDNFIRTYGIGICNGSYSDELISAWEDWDRLNKSENDHPQIFQSDQVYVVFAFADGGSDLEHFTLRTYAEAVSLLLQVTASLAVAEQACNFEHRDMHWGNILLARRDQEDVHYRLNGQTLRARSNGISVALIDFTLSRLDVDGRVLFCDLNGDTWLFEGPKGDVQAETYRRMLKATKGAWEGSFPQTNSFWIHYLVDIVLNRKSFACTPGEKHALRGFRKRSLAYHCAQDAVQDEIFAGVWIEGDGKCR